MTKGLLQKPAPFQTLERFIFSFFTSQLMFTVLVTAYLLQAAIVISESDVKGIDGSQADEVLDPEGAVAYDKSLYVVEQHTCSYFYGKRHPSLERGLVNCTWYTSKACCKRTEVTSVFSNMDPLYKASVLCRNYINYLMCFFCSPDQYKFYMKNKVMVCPDYCDSLYEECKSAGFNKTLIGDAYANGTAFCEAQDFDVVDNADCFKFDPTVFGHSHKISAWSFLTFVITICLCLKLTINI